MDDGSQPRKRIAMVGYTFYASDPRLIRHVARLVDAGYDVDVLTLRNPRGATEQDEEHVTFFRLQDRRYERQGKLQFIWDYATFTVRTAWTLLRNHLTGRRYNFIHINNMPNFLLFGALPLRMLGVRNLLDVHDTMPEVFMDRTGVGETHWMIRMLFFEEWLCLKLADFVVTTEHTKRDRLLESGLRQDRHMVLMNLADPGLFPEAVLPDEAPPNGDTFRIVFHGTLARRLGVDVAIRAVALLKDSIPGLRFEITGDGEQRPELVALTHELGLDAYVHFSDGFVPTVALPDILEGADLAVLPTRINVATGLMLPVKLLEYIRLGIPSITTRTPTISYYFDEPMVHFVEDENPQSLADTILHLYEHPEIRLDTAVQARRIYEQYDFDDQYTAYLDTVRRLAK